MRTNRRQFIKISALGAGGVAAVSSTSFGGSFLSIFDSSEDIRDIDFKRVPTYCEVCFWKCAGWTNVDKKGNVVKIIGNEDDPHCNGRLCPRGTGGVGMYTDTDRLKTPLIRVKGANGEEDTFREATWDEALDLIATKMKGVKEKYGPESFALLKHGSSGAHFEHLFKAYGSDTIGEPAYAQCRGPREQGFGATFGSWVGSPEPTDIRDTKCLVLIGSHIGENMHNSQVQELADAIDKKATIITVDPRLSTVAGKSQYWLPIKPATDIALLLSWMHVLIYENLVDEKYIEKYTYGFNELKEHVKNYTPEWAYGITTIEPSVIRKTAREMADAAPSVIVHPGRHVTWYGDDTQRSRAIAILNGLLGSWGKRGGFYLKEKLAIPKYPQPPYPHPEWGWEQIGEKYPLAQMGVTNEIIRCSIPEEDTEYKVKAWFVSGTNLPKSIPDKDQLGKALDSIEFLAVCDTMPMDITGYADVILPEATYLERYDGLRSATNREPSVALRAPAVEPKYNSKPSWWMAKQIGERLGLGAYFNYKDYADVLDWQLKKIGSSLEEMKRIGVKKFDRKSGPLYIGDGEDYEFATNTGKIELYSTELANMGHDPMPKYTAHDEPDQGYYRLIYGRAPMHTFSRTSNNPNLHDLMSENKVWVNPRVAKIWNLRNNQEVYLQNQDGVVSSFPVKVRVTERIRWDSVYMVHGFGNTDKHLTRAYGKGASDTELITKVSIDPLMGGTGMRGNFVTFITDKNLVES
ncbi:MAG: molybdopterin-dependent oxidoreductase [Cyclobacteriaceae bacterium]|nr:molybdopterin-dependent oxidoreductase [Cyclobacteriaceae bacterium]